MSGTQQGGQSGYPVAPTLGLGAGFPSDPDNDGDNDTSPDGSGDTDDDSAAMQAAYNDPNDANNHSPLMPTESDDGTNPGDAISRLATLAPPARMALAQAMNTPGAAGALMEILGPQFAGVVLSLEASGGGMDGMQQGPGPTMMPPGAPPPPGGQPVTGPDASGPMMQPQMSAGGPPGAPAPPPPVGAAPGGAMPSNMPPQMPPRPPGAGLGGLQA